MNKRKKKRIIIIAACLFFFLVIGPMIATPIVYGMIFKRYDAKETKLSECKDEQVISFAKSREEFKVTSGDNELQCYDYYNTSNRLLIVAPGFHATADDYIMQIYELNQLGYRVVSFDPTGCGNSEGSSQVGFSKEEEDMEAVLEYLQSKKFLNCDQVYLMGHSRGAYSVCLASEKYEGDVDAVVSVSGINSAMDAIMQSSVDAIGPVAYGNYFFLWGYQSILFGTDLTSEKMCEVIDETGIPTLIIQGEEDDTAPVDESSVYSHREHINSKVVRYYLCEKDGQDGHTDLLYDEDGTASDEVIQVIDEFLVQQSEE